MNSKKSSRCLFSAFCAVCALWAHSNSARANSFSFQGLGGLAGQPFGSLATAVSADGTFVVGSSNSGFQDEAFRWTSGSGMVGLGFDGFLASSASDVSADGSVVVGSRTDLGELEAFRWTSDGGMVGLGHLSSEPFPESLAAGVSTDGSVVVGYSSSAAGVEAFRWTNSGGMVGLGDLPGGVFNSTAIATSADGSVIVGYSTSAAGDEAFRWTSASGMVGLGDLPGGTFDSTAHAITPDGSVIVGGGVSASGIEAFRWTAVGGMVSLGHLPDTSSVAYGVSADGSVIVGGNGHFGEVSGAFIWTETLGMVNLQDLLIANGVAGLGGWTLTEARAVSQDGRTIVGWGWNSSEFDVEAWIATIPEPSSAVLLAVCAIGLTLAMRQRCHPKASRYLRCHRPMQKER